MEKLYPLKFKTIFKEKIWGGDKILRILGKDFSPLSNCGETWELSSVKDNVSECENGALKGKKLTDLIAVYKESLVGRKIYNQFGTEFPLLIKFIDANDDLSIQVHPDDALAEERHNSFGKTEMWYILQADENATLITGFNREIDKENFLKYFKEGRIIEILNSEKAKKGDVFFIPAGRIHTIGKGLLLAEIQQTSDVTYRIYDFNRTDKNGNKRALHVDKALEAIDYHFYDQYKTKYVNKINQPVNLVKCNYFTTNKLTLNKALDRNYTNLDSFKILLGIEGSAMIETNGFHEELFKGDVVLIPADLKHLTFKVEETCEMLEIFID